MTDEIPEEVCKLLRKRNYDGAFELMDSIEERKGRRVTDEENCSCGKEGFFTKTGNYYNNDTNSQYCRDCWMRHCKNVHAREEAAGIMDKGCIFE